ncbi:hypothetical protein EYF80_032949 [Liparis tanakae]|uniref:Uncharacterized protein n=1 Tax=Liparis tanakae TaxID=230148 RepID=A0A4Z2GVS1_9TELE|nr:hypothetical protein EYF80_032949 [Liparis tanakae]
MDSEEVNNTESINRWTLTVIRGQPAGLRQEVDQQSAAARQSAEQWQRLCCSLVSPQRSAVHSHCCAAGTEPGTSPSYGSEQRPLQDVWGTTGTGDRKTPRVLQTASESLAARRRAAAAQRDFKSLECVVSLKSVFSDPELDVT